MNSLVALACALALGAAAPKAVAADDASAALAAGERAPESQPAGEPRPDEVRFSTCRAGQYSCCMAGVTPCTRPRIARLVLGLTGAAAWAGGSSIFLVLGDRLGIGDPAGLMIGGGAAALVGVLAGGVVALVGGDGRPVADRIRRATVDLEYTFAPVANLDEVSPDMVKLRFGPTYDFRDGGGHVRLFGNIGGLLGTARDVDPRPQHTDDIEGQSGTSPVVLRERRLAARVGLELAAALPYPVLSPRRSPALGAVELRYRPEVRIRRHSFELGDADAQIEERTMLLPLTAGLRWHISPRQRLTFYAGPRFDLIAYSEPGSRDLARGPAQLGPMYGEAWYDIDIPLIRPDRRRRHGAPRPRPIDAVSQLRLGYLHSRFDGHGFDLGAAVGFLGPAHVSWTARVRRRGAKTAFQGGLGVWIGGGATAFITAGVVAPSIGARQSR